MPYNRYKRIKAFSYLEILVVLVIIGTVFSFARLQTSNLRLSKNVQVLHSKLQNEIDVGMLSQAAKNRKSLINIDLDKTCLPKFITVGYGGIVKPQKITCEISTFQVSPLGEVIINNE